MTKTLIRQGITLLCFFLILSSCKKEFHSASAITQQGVTKDGVLPFSFNWETGTGFMPTPPGQTQIPVPWIGQGSISSLYGIDVVNDIKAVDGWQLLYSTFDPNASGPLQNPYFILYNKYRGLMRVFLYLTGSFTATSNFLTDGLTLVSNTPSTLLAFAGAGSMVDLTQPHTSFTQVEKAPQDGSLPMAPDKWFMMQYEIAYDPGLAATPYNNIQLSWFTNYTSISQISLGGEIEGTLNGTITSSSNGMSAAFQNLGKAAGTVGLEAIGSSFLNNASGNYPGSNFTYDANRNITGTVAVQGNNNLGLPNAIFTSLKTGLSAGLSAAAGNIPGAIAGLFSAIIGGTSTTTQTVSLNLDASITLNGTSTSSGSFPASPTSVWVPGTQGLTTANLNSVQGYLPLYQSTLGVFNLSNAPVVHVTNQSALNSGGTGKGNTTYANSSNFAIDPGSYTIIFNPEVVNSNPDGATVSNILKEEALVTSGTVSGGKQETDGGSNIWTSTSMNIGSYFLSPSRGVPYPTGTTYLRVSFDITPNGNPAAKAHIIKTFLCQRQ
jgi:hypothetical protein